MAVVSTVSLRPRNVWGIMKATVARASAIRPGIQTDSSDQKPMA